MRLIASAVGLAVMAALLVGACDHVTGPSLTAVIESEHLTPTSTFANAANICCCHIQGVVRNTSSITVDLSLRWTVKDKGGADIGPAADYIKDVPAGAAREFDAAGIDKPCASVASIQRDVLVIGQYDVK